MKNNASPDLAPTTLGNWLSIIKSYRLIQADLSEKLRIYHNISLPQFQLLAQLANNPDGMRMSDLAQELLLSNGNITGLVARAQKRKLVARIIDQNDKRASNIHLSTHGKDVFIKIRKDYQIWVDELFSEMNSDAQRVLVQNFRDLRP